MNNDSNKIHKFYKKKAVPPLPGNPAFRAPLATRRSRLKNYLRDPWLSVSRLLGVWRFYEQLFLFLILFPLPECAINRPKPIKFKNVNISNGYTYLDI
jgi:hypothetical protein